MLSFDFKDREPSPVFGSETQEGESVNMESREQTVNTRAAGKRYEEQAAAYLTEQGYCIREKNFRCRLGEIDLIAEDQSREKSVLVFTEVKYRTSADSAGGPLAAVGIRKQKTISRVAQFYLMSNGLPEIGTPCRFDVIAITPEGITHIKDAFPYRP